MVRPMVAVSVAAMAMVLAAGVSSFSAPALGAAPEPSLVPVSWQLDIKYGNLQRIFVNIDGKDKPFWFLRYTVTNNSGKDVLFTPNFEIVADTGEVTPAFKDVPNAVFQQIKQNYGNSLLMSPTDIYGKLLQGEDNAKDGVAIFPALDSDARDFQLFVTGLSGETAEVKNPVTGKPVILQKALELDFNIPGEAIGVEPHPRLKSYKWVMK